MPTAVPALPDSDRITTYTITAQAGPFDVGFAVYGDSTDYQNWIEVWLGEEELTPVTDWTLSLVSGTLATAARPLTNAQITLAVASTGTLRIVSARRPRRTSQLEESQGVPARSFNQINTDIIASLREFYDLKDRMSLVPPGVTPPNAMDLKNVLDTNTGPTGPQGIPGIGFVEVTPNVEYYAHVNSQPVFTIRDDPTNDLEFGSPIRLDHQHPLFRVEQAGRGKLRTASIIMGDPGDTPEIGVYLAGGAPEDGSYIPWPKTSVGQQGFLQYNTPWAPSDANPADYVLANPNRLISPYKLTGGPNFTASKYITANSTMLVDGKLYQFKFVDGSGNTPTVNITDLRTGTATGAKAINRNSGATPAVNYWVAGTEVNAAWVAAANEFRATTDSDTAAGATYRNVFMNPNWARAVGYKTRFSRAPTETGRSMTFVVENSKPNETILRERFWVSHIGATVIGGTGSFEDAASDHGWTAEDNYPGEMANSALDPNYFGNFFAGLPGPHNSFNTPGWAALSLPMPSHDKWAGLGMRKSGTADVGLDISYDHSNEWFRFEGVKPSGSPLTIVAITQSPAGLCRVQTSASHGINRRNFGRVASVLGTTEANGAWTLWPVSSDTVDLEGTNFTNAYVSGGTLTLANGTTTAAFKTSTQDWWFGGTPTTAGLRIELNATGATRWKVLAGNAANPPTLKAEGEANTGWIIENTGTGSARFRTNDGDVLRLAGSTATKVNFFTMDGAAAGSGVTLSTGGTDSNVSMNINTQGTGVVAINPGGTVGFRVNRTATAVNYGMITPAATTGAPSFAVEGTDTNIGLNFANKGTGTISFTTQGGDVLRLSGATATKVNFLVAAGAATTGNPSLSAGGSDTNIKLNLLGQGTGGVTVKGTGTNDNAAAGDVGELITSTVLSGSAVSLTTNTAANVTTISLTAGDWDVWGTVAFEVGGTTVTSQIIGWISTTSATLPTSPNEGAFFNLNATLVTGGGAAVPVGQKRISLSGTTTVYLSARSAFTTSTSAAYGYIAARRVR